MGQTKYEKLRREIECIHPGNAELLSLFADIGLAFRNEDEDEDLGPALLEGPRFQTYRRGCGFTHATRLLQEPIFYPRIFRGSWVDELRQEGISDREWLLVSFLLPFRTFFSPAFVARLEVMHQTLDANGIHLSAGFQLFETDLPSQIRTEFADVLTSLSRLRDIENHLKHEEAKLFARMVRDCIFPKQAIQNICQINGVTEYVESGTCSTAERYFFKLVEKKSNLVSPTADGYHSQ